MQNGCALECLNHIKNEKNIYLFSAKMFKGKLINLAFSETSFGKKSPCFRN